MLDLINALKFISGPLTFVAFVFLVYTFWQRSREKHERELVRLAPNNNREKLVEISLRHYRQNYENLTRDQKFHLYEEEIVSQDRRYLIKCIVLCLLVFMGLFSFVCTQYLLPAHINTVTQNIKLTTIPESYATADKIPLGSQFVLTLQGLPADAKLTWSKPRCGVIDTETGNKVLYTAEKIGRDEFFVTIHMMWFSINQPINFNIGDPL
jgi:hypothetical protein